MQIDFHHTVTYVTARLAGFEHAQAEIVAYAAQYVDDSTSSGFLRFENGMRYQRSATAHPMLDGENLLNDDNALSWLPFHFLPGADTLATDYNEKLVCRPDSSVARAMMASAIRDKERPHGLHRLGIAAHVFVDTFAHQGFVGQWHDLNTASAIRDVSGDALGAVPVPPVGHGLVDTYPDQPYLRWSYVNSKGEKVIRDNPTDFAKAADRLCQEFQRYQLGNPEAVVPGLGAHKESLTTMFLKITDADENVRHKEWLAALASDHFGFGSVNLRYDGKGVGSWKHQALGDRYIGWHQAARNTVVAQNTGSLSAFQRIGTSVVALAHKAEALADRVGIEPPTYRYSPEFLTSNYKRFHDAVRDQRHAVFTQIFPSFGICAA